MCLLIAGKAADIRSTLLNTPDLLEDIFLSNSDGVGAMYTTSKGKLRTPKVLPKNLNEARNFIASLPNDERQLALHWRMKTHGHIDLENCHPYTVLPGRVALMHNGILSQGNKADVTKSDTWHYIKDVVRPILDEYPKAFMNPGVQKLLEEDITDSNRFAIMDHEGDLVILNRETGIEHAGLWFSNTYAWDPALLIPGYKKAYKWPKNWDWGTDDDYVPMYSKYKGATSTGYGQVIPLGNGDPVGGGDEYVEDDDFVINEDEIWNALSAMDADEVADLLDCRPNFVLRTIFADCEFTCTVEHEMNRHDEEIVKMLADEDVPGLVRTAMMGMHYCRGIAEAMCWYGEWHGKSIDKRQAADEKAQAELQAELDEQQAAYDEADRVALERAAALATVDNETYAG